ncbi:MAG: hypothetical protein Q4B70_04255, partial [Lachnospiraceae bacterium]|nr:hypothetical protein [Lachnospiraceae bacterium]
TNTTMKGTLILEDKIMDVGAHNYQWTFTPDDLDNYDVLTGNISLKAEKRIGKANIAIGDWTYGDEALQPQPESETNGISNVSYQYKKQEEEDSEYKDYNVSEKKYPTETGEYVLKAVFPETDEYKEVVLTKSFSIKRADISTADIGINVYAGIYDGKNHDIVTGVTGNPEGTTISYSISSDYDEETDDGTWSAYDEECSAIIDAQSIYVKVKIEGKNYNTFISEIKKASILQRELTDFELIFDEEKTSFVYNGDMIELLPKVSVKDGNQVLKNGTDYVITGNKNTDVGEYSLKVNGMGNYCGELQGDYSITQADSSIQIAEGKDAYEKKYGEDSFPLEGIHVIGDGTLEYEVTASEDTDGNTVQEDEIISVNEDGVVSINGIGQAVITVSMAETKNYKEAESQTITVSVARGVDAANMPDATISPEFTKGATIEEIELPENWEWVYTDTLTKDTEITAGKTIVLTVKYTGADADKYQNTTKEISITMAACTHETTELVVDKQAGCTSNGVGHRVCTVCGETVEDNVSLPMTSHSWSDWRVVKEPTYDATGLEERTCSKCKEVETREIAKLEQIQNTTETTTESTTEATTQKTTETVKVSKVTKPGKVKNLKVTVPIVKKKQVKKQLTLKWKAIKNVAGYQVQISLSSKFASNKKYKTKSYTVKTAGKTIKKLSSKKKYYVRVRAYKLSGKTKVYGSWSSKTARKTK